MSLLMDALKRAEQEKREAAKRLKEAQGNTQGDVQGNDQSNIQDELDRSGQQGQERIQEHNLDDRTLTQELSTEDDSFQAATTPRPEQQRSVLDDTAEIDGLTLAPVEDRRMVLEDMALEDKVLEDIDDSIDQDGSLPGVPIADTSSADTSFSESELSQDDERDDARDDRLSSTDNIELEISGVTADENKPARMDQTLALTTYPDEEPAAMDDITRAEQEFEDADTGKKASSDEYEYFSATVSAAQLAKDIGSDSPTPVAAQTVFTATATKPASQIWQWTAFAVLCVAIAVSLSFFIFTYTVPSDRLVKSPMVAKDIETQSEPVPAIEIPEEFMANADVDNRLFSGEITDVIEKQNNIVVDKDQMETGTVAADEETKAVGDQLAMAKEKLSPSTNENSAMQTESLPEPQSEPQAIAQKADKTRQTLPEEIELEPKLIKISRSRSVDKHSVLINVAYEDYRAGNYVSAEAGYREVLKALPENRDALLGLAAISMRKGQMQQAYTHYLEVLKLYPGDSVAEAALINFKGNKAESRDQPGDLARNESTLKTFLQKEPDNSFLHYSLGRLYATQKRWSEAQKSFFDAYSIEASNPDYAFNLAVSLDHIGQQQSAMDYYQTALDLAQNTNEGSADVGFDRSVVIARISALSGTSK